jgi:hypothetical protein
MFFYSEYPRALQSLLLACLVSHNFAFLQIFSTLIIFEHYRLILNALNTEIAHLLLVSSATSLG